MPRNSSGTYTLPAGNPVAPNTLIETNWANPTLSDIASSITDSLDRLGRGTMLAPLKIFDGSAVAPALAFNSEATTGLFRPAGASLGVAVLGSEVARFTAAALELFGGLTVAGALAFTGNLTLTGDLDITGNLGLTGDITTTGAADIGTTLTVAGLFSANGGAVLGDAAADPLTINSNTATIANGLSFMGGNVGIGVASPPVSLTVLGPVGNGIIYTDAIVNLALGTTATPGGFIGTTTAHPLILSTTALERVRVEAGGNVGIGTTTPLNRLHVASAAASVITAERAIIPAGGQGIGGIEFRGGSNLSATAAQLYAFIVGAADVPTAGAQNGSLIFNTTLVGVSAEKARISPVGYLGIGTTNPAYPIDITRNGVDTTAGWFTVARFLDGTSNKGLSIGYEAATQTTALVAGTLSSLSNMAFWLFSGSSWTDRVVFQGDGLVNFKRGSGSLLLAGHITRYESAEQPYPTGPVNLTNAHGGSRVPDYVQVFARCKSAEGGWVLNDEIQLNPVNATGQNMQQAASTVLLYFQYNAAGAPVIMNTAGATITPTAANWRLVYKAIWL